MTPFAIVNRIVFVCLILLSQLSAFAQQKKQSSQKVIDGMILDSLEVLVQVGGVMDGIAANASPSDQRYWEIRTALWSLSKTQSEKLLTDSNVIKRLYGFSTLCKTYYGRMKPTDLDIFNDTTSLMMYANGQLIHMDMTTGDYARMVYQSAIAEHSKDVTKEMVEKAVSEFIRAYAAYPKSYVPGSYADFSKGYLGDGPKADHWEIKHTFSLADTSGQLREVSYYFIFDSFVNVNLIESERSDAIHSARPRYGDWLNTFGRTLTDDDRNMLKLD